MKDLINELRTTAKEIASYGHAGWGNVCKDAADALEQLTSGDVELPKYDIETHDGVEWSSSTIKDYGNRRAAQAVLSERERVKG